MPVRNTEKHWYQSDVNHGRPQKFFQGDKVDILLTVFTLLTTQCQNGLSQNASNLLENKQNAPCYANSNKNCASFAAIAGYITITS